MKNSVLFFVTLASLSLLAAGCSGSDNQVSTDSAGVANNAQVVDPAQNDKQKQTSREGGNANTVPGAGRTGSTAPPPL
jgi:hypothetical protein